MSYQSHYKKGDSKSVCDGCGFYFKASQLRKDWQGFMKCSKDWEPKHAQLETPPVSKTEGRPIKDGRSPGTLPVSGPGYSIDDVYSDDIPTPN